MITKGIWPAAPREALVSGYILPSPSKDRTYLNLTTDLQDHPALVSRPGDVRMHIKIAGQRVGPHPTESGGSRVVQLVDGDLGGWLPKSIVSIVATQALPTSMKR
jgi:hypothetical protein